MKAISVREILCAAIVLGPMAASAGAADIDAEPVRRALLIGVNKYDDARAIHRDGNLSFAERDAQQLAAALEARGFAADSIVTMTTGSQRNDRLYPTAANIRRQVRAIAGRLDDGDSIVVSFSGFEMQFAGDDDYYLCPADADASDPHTLVSLREVCTILDRAKGEGKLVIVDSCRSMERPGPRRALTPRLSARSVGVLFACSAGQYAAETPEKQQGTLSYFLVKGLRGAADADRDGIVTASELFAYAKAGVAKSAPDQTPDVIGALPRIDFIPKP